MPDWSELSEMPALLAAADRQIAELQAKLNDATARAEIAEGKLAQLTDLPAAPSWPVRWMGPGWYRLVWDSDNFNTKRNDLIWMRFGVFRSHRHQETGVVWLEEEQLKEFPPRYANIAGGGNAESLLNGLQELLVNDYVVNMRSSDVDFYVEVCTENIAGPYVVASGLESTLAAALAEALDKLEQEPGSSADMEVGTALDPANIAEFKRILLALKDRRPYIRIFVSDNDAGEILYSMTSGPLVPQWTNSLQEAIDRYIQKFHA